MTSAPPNNASTTSGKSLNTSSHAHSPLQQSHQASSPAFESSLRRSSSSHPSIAQPSGRNNQGKKKAHKSSKRPQLAGEDMMAETVCMESSCGYAGYHIMVCHSSWSNVDGQIWTSRTSRTRELLFWILEHLQKELDALASSVASQTSADCLRTRYCSLYHAHNADSYRER